VPVSPQRIPIRTPWAAATGWVETGGDGCLWGRRVAALPRGKRGVGGPSGGPRHTYGGPPANGPCRMLSTPRGQTGSRHRGRPVAER